MAPSRRLLLLVSSMLLWAAPAVAQQAPPTPSKEDVQAARQHFDRGRKLIQQKYYGKAIVELEEAYRLDPKSAQLYNLGVAHHLKGDRATAIDYYRRFLAAQPAGGTARKAKTYLTGLEKQIEAEEKAAEDARKAAEAVRKAAEPAPDPEKEKAMRNAIAEAEERAREAEREAARQRAAADARRHELERAAVAQRAADERLRLAREAAAHERACRQRTLRTSAWIALGVGAAGAVTAGAFGGLARHEAAKLDEATPMWSWRDDASPYYERATTYRTVSYASAVVGVVGLATGGALLWLGREGEASPAMTGATLAPAAGPGQVGVNVVGRF